MQVDASRLVSLQTLSARLRLLLNLFEHEGALAGDCAWSGIGNLLLPAACVARLEVDASAADLYEAGQHCSSSADYDDRQSRMLDDYMSALARYHFVWTAYETIRFDSDAGRLMTSGSSADREVFVARVPPALLKLLNQVYAVCGSLTRESDEIQRRLRRQQPEATVIGKSGRLASGFRNYVFHGDEQPPEPDDWDGQFQRGLDGTETVSLQSYRLVSFNATDASFDPSALACGTGSGIGGGGNRRAVSVAALVGRGVRIAVCFRTECLELVACGAVPRRCRRRRSATWRPDVTCPTRHSGLSWKERQARTDVGWSTTNRRLSHGRVSDLGLQTRLSPVVTKLLVRVGAGWSRARTHP